jgi:hypothetical protein
MEVAQSVKSHSVHGFNQIFLYFHLEHDIKYYNSEASKEWVNVEVKKGRPYKTVRTYIVWYSEETLDLWVQESFL